MADLSASSAFIRANLRLRLLTSNFRVLTPLHLLHQSFPSLHVFLFAETPDAEGDEVGGEVHGLGDLEVGVAGEEEGEELVVLFFHDGVFSAEGDVEFGGEGFDAGVGREAVFFVEEAGVAEDFESGDAQALGDLAAGEAVEQELEDALVALMGVFVSVEGLGVR